MSAAPENVRQQKDRATEDCFESSVFFFGRRVTGTEDAQSRVLGGTPAFSGLFISPFSRPMKGMGPSQAVTPP